MAFPRRWKRTLQQLTHIFRWLGGVRRQMLELIPELHWVAELAEGQQAQPAMLFRQDKGFAAHGQGVTIALFDCLGSHSLCKVQVFFLDRDINAGG